MKTREFTQEEILKSKGYVKGMATNYAPPSTLFDSVLNLHPEKFEMTLQGSHADINVNDDKSENISFGRVNVQYTFNIDDDLKYNLGLIVALDKQKPVAKIYTGVQVKACLNLCIFGADQYQRFDISSSGMSYKEPFLNEFKKVNDHIERARLMISHLKRIELKQADCDLMNGIFLRKVTESNSVAGTTPIINAIKLQADKLNKYYTGNGTNAWLYYNSLTEYLAEKVHILDQPEKAWQLFKCLDDHMKFDPVTNQKLLESNFLSD